MVSPAEATTSATGSLTSGDDHLSADDSGHLYTGGRRLPQHTRRGPHSCPHCGSEDKTIQERGRRPRGVRRLVRPPPPENIDAPHLEARKVEGRDECERSKAWLLPGRSIPF